MQTPPKSPQSVDHQAKDRPQVIDNLPRSARQDTGNGGYSAQKCDNFVLYGLGWLLRAHFTCAALPVAYQEQQLHMLFSKILWATTRLSTSAVGRPRNICKSYPLHMPIPFHTDLAGLKANIFSTQSFLSSENDSSCPDTIRHGASSVLAKSTTEALGFLANNIPLYFKISSLQIYITNTMMHHDHRLLHSCL